MQFQGAGRRPTIRQMFELEMQLFVQLVDVYIFGSRMVTTPGRKVGNTSFGVVRL